MLKIRSSWFRRSVVVFFVVLAVLYVAGGAFIYFQQDRIGFPVISDYERVTPAALGIPFEDLQIPVNGTEHIHAWWLPAPSDRVLLLFHGGGYVLEDNISLALSAKSGLPPPQRVSASRQLDLLALQQLGVNILAFDYRGCGSSTPLNLTEKTAYEDGRAALTYLTVQRRIPSRKIVLAGWSLGTGPATEIAKEYPDVGGLVLVSAYTTLPDLIKYIPEFWYVRPLPYRLLLHTKFDNLSKMNSVHVPVLLIVGSVDNATVPSMAKALFQKANEPKRLYLSPGASHVDIWDIKTDQVIAEISGFIQTLH
jgi:pimeloyl-ACP methyl ester carboxylesterase